jgi:hypothetical protein
LDRLWARIRFILTSLDSVHYECLNPQQGLWKTREFSGILIIARQMRLYTHLKRRNRSRRDRDWLPDRRDIPVPPNECAGLENPAYRGFGGPRERLQRWCAFGTLGCGRGPR